MKKSYLILVLVIFTILSCKTKKETVNPEPVPSQQKKELTDEEKQQMSQLEYRPEDHQKSLTPDGKQIIESLAQEKANIKCKKQETLKRIEAGEQVDPSELTMFDSMLDEFNKKMVKFVNEPAYMQYFEEKFAEYLKGCSK